MIHCHRNVILATPLILALAGGCSEPISYSAPVGIELKADAGKAVDGVLSDEKGITSESGNPYGAFINDAERALGRDPSRIELVEVTVLLGADSTGVTMLNEIFDGRVDVLFEMDSTEDTFPAAHITIDGGDAGGGPMTLDVDYDDGAVQGQNRDKLENGSFKVVYRGPVAVDFVPKDAKADLQITFTFEAYE